MANYSNVILGMNSPEENAEGETVVIKDGKYDTALGLVILEFEVDNTDLVSKKTAGEILDLANGGAILVVHCAVAENDIIAELVNEYKLDTGTYTLTGATLTGTSTDADDPIVISGS